MSQNSSHQGTSEVNIRLGYAIRCGSITIKISDLRIIYPAGSNTAADIVMTVVSNGDAGVSVRVHEVDMYGTLLKVRDVRVNVVRGIINHSFPVNLGVEDISTSFRFLYFEISDLECKESPDLLYPSIEVCIGKILIYPLEGLRVTRYRVFQEHENPFSAMFTAEYTVVNNMPFPVRFLYLDLQRYIKGLEVRDEEDRVLRFLTRQELREIFGEDIIDKLNEFFVVVDLGEGLDPGGAKVLRLTGTEEIDRYTRNYFLGLTLYQNLTEGVVIRPPHGYEVVINKEKDIVVVRDVSEITKNSDSEMVRRVFNDRDLARPIFTGSDDNRKSVKLDPKFRLDRFVNPVPKKGDRIASPAVVDLQFRLYEDKESSAEKPLFDELVENPGIAIRYSLEVQHKGFWDALLTFFSVLVFGLFFQELSYDTAIDLGSSYPSLLSLFYHDFATLFALTLALGAAIGYLFAASNRLVRGRKGLLKSLALVIVYSLIAIIIATSFGLTTPILIVSEVGKVYVELEFATLVAVELAYFLAERAVRDEYRGVLLILTALTLVSMLLLIPWIA